ncbi:hypothetical protein [Neisseria sp. Ec49-e6-T10]|uniref:hypothetical protein n=1 Tax=Neisseria sp. Ec49-e6-T10 TaxID=3140744 RepID=UPI003EB808A1
METVIIISEDNDLLKKINQDWEKSNFNIFFEKDKLNIEFEKDRIYLDKNNEIEGDFEENELKYLKNIFSHSLSFYLISYSDKTILKYFLTESHSLQNTYIDDDHDKLTDINSFLKDL